MKLSVGIIGLPNVGKSTLFKLITKKEVLIANYPFATIDPNVGVVAVPDDRLNKLAELSKSKKIVPAIVEFYDIAGLVKGANQGEGLGNKFLSHIQDVNAIVHVVRSFQDDNIIHIEQDVNPVRDLEIINTELMLRDLDTLEKRITKLESELRRLNDKEKVKDLEALNEIKSCLSKNILVANMTEDVKTYPLLKELGLLTEKPQIYLLNGCEDDISEELKDVIKSLQADYVTIDLSTASDINLLIQKTYTILGLISFLTTGEDETRAWTIPINTLANVAAGVIHSDFEKKFIRAEVINWQKLLDIGGWTQAKQKGLVRTEGKQYIVNDGDVMEIRHG